MVNLNENEQNIQIYIDHYEKTNLCGLYNPLGYLMCHLDVMEHHQKHFPCSDDRDVSLSGALITSVALRERLC